MPHPVKQAPPGEATQRFEKSTGATPCTTNALSAKLLHEIEVRNSPQGQGNGLPDRAHSRPCLYDRLHGDRRKGL
jgi:hypothetical protein